MATKPHRPKRGESALSLLDAAIDGLNLVKELSSATPAKAIFGTVTVLLTMIKVYFLFFGDEMPQS